MHIGIRRRHVRFSTTEPVSLALDAAESCRTQKGPMYLAIVL